MASLPGVVVWESDLPRYSIGRDGGAAHIMVCNAKVVWTEIDGDCMGSCRGKDGVLSLEMDGWMDGRSTTM
jgi:hypothetical protein